MVCLPFWPMCLLGINICVVIFKLLYVFLINFKNPPFPPIKFLLVLSFSSKIFQLVVKRKAFLAGNPETYPSCLKYYAKYDILFSVNLSSDNISVGKKQKSPVLPFWWNLWTFSDIAVELHLKHWLTLSMFTRVYVCGTPVLCIPE